jgi:hypothetical protein
MQSAEFSNAGCDHYAAGRALKAAQVSDALRSDGLRRSDQSVVRGAFLGEIGKL